MIPDSEGNFLQFDDILKSIGEFGSRQKFLFILTCVFVNIPAGFQLAGMFFITGTPKFQCATPNVTCDVDKCCANCTKYEFIQDFTSTSTEVSVPSFVDHRPIVGLTIGKCQETETGAGGGGGA